MTKAELAEELKEKEYELSARKEEFERGIEYARKSCDKLEEENTELKRLLKLAVEDIEGRSYCSMCKNGVYNYNDECKRCNVITLDMFKWGHKDEAMKLIGGNENQIDKQEK